MEALIAAAIVAGYFCGRAREWRRWEKQRRLYLDTVDGACARRDDAIRAFDIQMDVIRQQRDLLDTFADATDRLYATNGHPEAWQRLSFAANRFRTESI